MSNVFVKGTAPFYPVPQFLITSGLLRSLSAGALKLYQLLLFAAQQRTRVELELSNLEIRQLANLSPNTIRRARTELRERDLIDLRQTPGGRYTYVILNPVTRKPLPNPRSTRGASSPSTLSPLPAPSPASSETPPWSQIGK
jgi:hypothetical protein